MIRRVDNLEIINLTSAWYRFHKDVFNCCLKATDKNVMDKKLFYKFWNFMNEVTCVRYWRTGELCFFGLVGFLSFLSLLDINPLRAKFLRRNIIMYLQFLSYLPPDMTQVF